MPLGGRKRRWDYYDQGGMSRDVPRLKVMLSVNASFVEHAWGRIEPGARYDNELCERERVTASRVRWAMTKSTGLGRKLSTKWVPSAWSVMGMTKTC